MLTLEEEEEEYESQTIQWQPTNIFANKASRRILTPAELDGLEAIHKPLTEMERVQMLECSQCNPTWQSYSYSGDDGISEEMPELTPICNVCCVVDANVALFPCGHLIACRVCALRYKLVIKEEKNDVVK